MTVNELAIAAKTDSNYILPLWVSVRKLIAFWANRYIKEHNPCYDSDDLIQSGYFALLRAVEQYPIDCKYKFTTYLNYHCRNEFSGIMGIRTSKREPYSYSLDKPLTTEGNFTLSDTLEDSTATEEFENAVDKVYNVQLHDALEQALNTIEPQNKRAIVAYFYNGKSHKEIAEEFNCSHSRPGQLISAGIRALRRGKSYKLLKDFDYERYGLRATGYMAFRHNMQSSVEGAVMKKLEQEEFLKLKEEVRAYYEFSRG